MTINNVGFTQVGFSPISVWQLYQYYARDGRYKLGDLAIYGFKYKGREGYSAYCLVAGPKTIHDNNEAHTRDQNGEAVVLSGEELFELAVALRQSDSYYQERPFDAWKPWEQK